ncbi:MAG: AI-2E family transporter [Bacteroidetes bacterium]|nr:AI-2E family transporter [Bacteroidota bacterium]
MEPKNISAGILRAIGILFGIVLLLYFLYVVRSVILYIGIAAAVSLIGRPMVIFLRERLKFRNTPAVILTILVIIAIIIGIFSLLIPVVIQQSHNLSNIDFNQLRQNLNDLSKEISAYFGSEQLDIMQSLQATQFFQKFEFNMIPNALNYVFNSVGSLGVGLFSVIFISFFLLKDSNLMLESILVFSKTGSEDKFFKVFTKTKNLLSRYFIGLVFQILILFVIYTIILVVFDVDNPVAVALICAFLNIIPYVGPLFAGFLMLLLTVSSNLGADFQSVILPKLIYVLSGYALAQLIDNVLSQPLIFSKSVRSHPLEIFLVILIGGLVFGIGGMLVAVPGYTAIKVISKEFLSEYKIVKSLTKNM